MWVSLFELEFHIRFWLQKLLSHTNFCAEERPVPGLCAELEIIPFQIISIKTITKRMGLIPESLKMKLRSRSKIFSPRYTKIWPEKQRIQARSHFKSRANRRQKFLVTNERGRHPGTLNWNVIERFFLGIQIMLEFLNLSGVSFIQKRVTHK